MNTTVVCCICDSTVISPVTLSAGLDFYCVQPSLCLQQCWISVQITALMSLSRLIGYWHHVAPACYDINQLENITEEKTIQFAHFETKFNSQTGLHFILAKLREDLSNLKYLVTDCCKRWLREDKSLTSPDIFFTCSAILYFNYLFRQNTLPVVYLMIVLFVYCQCTGFPCFSISSLLLLLCEVVVG